MVPIRANWMAMNRPWTRGGPRKDTGAVITSIVMSWLNYLLSLSLSLTLFLFRFLSLVISAAPLRFRCPNALC